MKKYSFEINKTAERQLKKIAKLDQKKIIKAIIELQFDPLPKGVRKLTGYDDVYRIRVGSYRVIYSIENRRLIILVLKIGHRKDIYR